MKKTYMLLLLGLLTAPAALGAQVPEERIEAARERALQANIPIALLEDRIAEGRAKGVPAARIADVVERRLNALTTARTALSASGTFGAPELSAGADAVEAGIPSDAIRQVVAGARAEDRSVALAVLTYLHREQGLPVQAALDRVAEAMERGPEALRSLPEQAAGRARGQGGRPGNQPGRPDGVGRGGGGPPSGVPAPGQRPGGGRPAGAGRPDGAGPPGNVGNPGRP